ncbi:SIR2 family protein [Shouchella miscanthi]|uniref:NAD(+) hydrolase ThsA n=1 Tax=Shouchella miscanthi TaxID=2598861 RepID=A0ABU6NJX8_9BACI|nr:SIR2 family protein [Shouchella miscanthi]
MKKYNPEIKEFLRSYVRDILDSNAAVFAGAGLSQPAGYVNWKELLRDIAEDIGLNIDQESDLIALAQYHVNEFGSRSKINQVLIDEFTKRIKTTKNHTLLAQLPINTYWTTNYDQLIENNLEMAGKKVDKKFEQENITYSVPGKDVTVYKMHGDSGSPHKAVLTKDDYEDYDRKGELFITALRGYLVSKTFLFIGFSFDDPNLAQILSKIKVLLNEDKRTHYCFMRRIKEADFMNNDEFSYAEVKLNLKIKDLQRYGIKVLLIDEYEEITDILEYVNALVKRKNIFISGSASSYGEWGELETFSFSANLNKHIIYNKYNIVSGFGLGIGSSVISGALEEIYSEHEIVENRLICRPFPQVTPGTDKEELWDKYRHEMIKNVGIAIFIFGNKIKNDNLVNADGLEKEFIIAIENGVIPIPIGSTGFMSKILWDKVMGDFETYVGIEELRPLYNKLGDKSIKGENLLKALVEIIKILSR